MRGPQNHKGKSLPSPDSHKDRHGLDSPKMTAKWLTKGTGQKERELHKGTPEKGS